MFLSFDCLYARFSSLHASLVTPLIANLFRVDRLHSYAALNEPDGIQAKNWAYMVHRSMKFPLTQQPLSTQSCSGTPLSFLPRVRFYYASVEI